MGNQVGKYLQTPLQIALPLHFSRRVKGVSFLRSGNGSLIPSFAPLLILNSFLCRHTGIYLSLPYLQAKLSGPAACSLILLSVHRAYRSLQPLSETNIFVTF